jgi:adenylosuccinate lyase
MWLYISQNYLIQQPNKGEVGSSTMPHKINPIDFENAEGNLKLANALILHLAQTLPVSRLQRDLSGSTQMRNIGVAFSHSLLAYQSTLKGLLKIKLNVKIMQQDFINHPEILAEAIQTVLRVAGEQSAYQRLKDFTRGQKITLNKLNLFIDQLKLTTSLKDKLTTLNPQNYIGLAAKLTNKALKE